MAYFGEAYMGRRRQQWLRSLAYVEAQTNGTWHRGTINQKKIEGENVVVMATFPTLDSIACTINASRLIDTYGILPASGARVIVFWPLSASPFTMVGVIESARKEAQEKPIPWLRIKVTNSSI